MYIGLGESIAFIAVAAMELTENDDVDHSNQMLSETKIDVSVKVF